MSHLVPVFESFESHTLTILKKDNGEAWFLAKSLASPLGVGRDSIRHQIAELDESDKGVISIHTPGGPQEMSFVSESGALQIIVQSRKPEARRLRKWVCDLAVRYAKGQVATVQVTRQEFDQLSRKLDAALGKRKMLKPARQSHDPRVELTRKFFAEHTVLAPGYQLRSDELCPALVSYLIENGAAVRAAEPQKQYVEMGILVSKAGVQKVRSKQCNFIPGVKLRQEQGAA